MKRDAFQVRECPVCKKQFVPAAFHAYKVHIGTNTKKVCKGLQLSLHEGASTKEGEEMTCRNCYKEKFCLESDRDIPCRCFKEKGKGNDNRKAEKVQRVKVRA